MTVDSSIINDSVSIDTFVVETNNKCSLFMFIPAFSDTVHAWSCERFTLNAEEVREDKEI